MGLLECIRACHRWEPGRFRSFVVDDVRMGFVHHDVAALLAKRPDVFVVAPAAVRLVPGLATPDDRTAAVADALRPLQDEGRLPPWRGEAYAVVRRWGDAPAFLVDRGAAASLGIRSFGIHLNGIVRRDGDLHVWLGRRSDRVAVDAGKLDHVVAGGQPAGLSLDENLAKECDEEASIPAEMARRARPAGAVTYRLETPAGLKDDTIFVYDLALPADFTPVNRDGETASFDCWSARRVLRTLRDDASAFKFNVGPVLVDFLVRHGVVGPDEPGYVAIQRALRS